MRFPKKGRCSQQHQLLGARAAFAADVPDHLWQGYDFGRPIVTNRLDQGPFGVTQDEGWYTIFATQPSRKHVRNFGTGLVGYTWEENGPALTVQCGKQSVEQAVESMASLPFVDVLYIRCDCRDIHAAPGKLELPEVWPLSLTQSGATILAWRFAFSSPAPTFNRIR